MINKYSIKVGEKIKYRIPSAQVSQNPPEYVHTTVKVAPENVEYPVIELDNGHTALWNGKLYQLEEMAKTILHWDEPMKEMVAADLKKLVHGDTVHKFSPYNDGDSRRLRYVGRMPSSDNYLIFSDGEHLEHLYINERDKTFRGRFFSGEYDSVLFGNMIIEYYEKKIKSTRKIWLKEEV